MRWRILKKKNYYFLTGFIMSIFLLLAACSSDETSDTPSDNTNTEDKQGVVNIGFSGPLSGAAALYGDRTLSGLQLGFDEINDSGGFKVGDTNYTINLVALDDKYLPNETAANAKRLIQEHKTPMIFTPHSGGAMAMQVFNEMDKFIIGAYTSEPSITQTGNKLTVRIPPKYDGYIEPFTKNMMNLHGKKIAALPTSTQYGKDWTELLLPYWEEQGGEVVFNSSINFAKDTDFFTIVTNALNEKPDVMFVGGPSEPTAKVIKQARELGFEGGFIVMDQAKFDEMEKIIGGYEELEGSVGVFPLIYSSFPGTKGFIENYSSQYDFPPGSEAGYNYLAGNLLVEAMKAAGSVDDATKIYEHFAEGISNLPEEKQVYDPTGIDKDGGIESKVRYGAIEDGKVVEKPIE